MKRITLFLILIMLLVSACGPNNEGDRPADPIDAYLLVIDKLYEEDTVLNDNIKYLAIDTTTMANLNDDNREILLEELDKYGHTVLDMTFYELEEEEYIRDLYFQKGILIRIEDEVMEDNIIKMNASKWKSGLGAIGYDGMTLEYNGEVWEVTGIVSNWIS